MMERAAIMARQGDQMPPQRCPRCDSTHTKFCYFNNYSSSQPRYFCKACRRYWTHGGTLRNVPLGGGGGGGRKGKRSKKSPSSSAAATTVASPPTTQPGPTLQVDHEAEVEPTIAAGLDASTPVMPYLYYGGGMELGGGGAAVVPLFETQFHYGLNLMTPPMVGGQSTQQAGWQQVSGGAAAINPAAAVAGDGGEGYWRELMFSAGGQGSSSNWAAEMARRGPRAPPFI